MLDSNDQQLRIYLSIGLAGNVSICNHFLEVWPKDVNSFSQGERDTHRLLQTSLYGSLTPGRAVPSLHMRPKCSYADESSISAT